MPNSSYNNQVKHHLMVFVLIMTTTAIIRCIYFCVILDQTKQKFIVAVSSYRFLTKVLPFSDTQWHRELPFLGSKLWTLSKYNTFFGSVDYINHDVHHTLHILCGSTPKQWNLTQMKPYISWCRCCRPSWEYSGLGMLMREWISLYVVFCTIISLSFDIQRCSRWQDQIREQLD